MKRLLVLVLVTLALLGSTAIAVDTIAKKAKEPRCFGLKATVRDHTGAIDGTAGDDVIIGDDGPNNIRTGGGGVDRVCGLGGDDDINGGGSAVLFADGGPGDDQLSESVSGPSMLLGGGGTNTLLGNQGGSSGLLGGPEGEDETFGGGNDVCQQEPGAKALPC